MLSHEPPGGMRRRVASGRGLWAGVVAGGAPTFLAPPFFTLFLPGVFFLEGVALFFLGCVTTGGGRP